MLRNIFKKKLLSILILMLFYLVLNAQLTLFDCIDAALKNSFDIKIASDELTKQKYYHKNTIYSFLPSFTLSKNYTQSIRNTEYSKNGMDASMQLDLFDNRFWDYKLSSVSLKQAKIDFEEKRKNIIIEVIDNYLSLNLLMEKQLYYTNILNDYKKQLNYIKQLMSTGDKTLFDVYSVKIEIKNIEIKLENTNGEIKNIIAKLNYLTGFSAKNGNDFKKFIFQELPIPQKHSINKAYEILSSELNLKLKSIKRQKTFTSLLPSLSVAATYSYSQEEDRFIFIKNRWKKNWFISLNFTYDLGNFLKNYNYLKISSLDLYDQRLKLKKSLALGKLDNKKQITTLKFIKKQITLDKNKLDFAKQKFELAKQKYSKGLLDFFMLKDSANEMLNAKISLIKDEKDFIITLVNYQKSIGEKILNKY